MPINDPPYGGRIEVRKNGSVLWQVAAREFGKDRDTDGTLEYAIRMVDASRNMVTSRDGKCLVTVSESALAAAPGQAADGQAWKFLIVSGYDAPVTPYDGVIVGSSYYITGAQYDPTAAGLHGHVNLPCYQLTLRYDDYDLQRAGLPLDLEPRELRLVYENWISLRAVLEALEQQAARPQGEDSSSGNRLHRQRERLGANEAQMAALLKAWGLPGSDLNILLKWAGAGKLFEEQGIHWDLAHVLEQLILVSLKVNASNAKDLDVWFSRWLPVAKRVEESERSLDFRTVSVPIVEADEIPTPKNGSRHVTAKGLMQAGTFALMYYKQSGEHDEYEQSEAPAG